MNIRTVSDLKQVLTDSKMSPEVFAKQVKISGMTLRRWLRKSPSTPIPEKYYATLDTFTGTEVDLGSLLKVRGQSSFQGFLDEIEESGKNCKDLEKLKRDTKAKFKDRNVGKELRDMVLLVLKSVFSKDLPLKYRALCIGGLLYFINPYDLIPDAIPVVGYLDDFAVLSLVVGLLAKHAHSEAKKAQATT